MRCFTVWGPHDAPQLLLHVLFRARSACDFWHSIIWYSTAIATALQVHYLIFVDVMPETSPGPLPCSGMPPASAAVGGLRRFFDISVPRNIAPDIGEDIGGRVYNVDDLKEVVSKNKEERRKAADEACVLLEEEQLAFEAWRDSLETVPTIKVPAGQCLRLCMHGTCCLHAIWARLLHQGVLC